MRSLAMDCRDRVNNIDRLDLFLDMYLQQTGDELVQLRKDLKEIYKFLSAIAEQEKLEASMTDLERIEQRARRYKQLLRAIPAVVVTLHDVNESGGFFYLDLFAERTSRLNKQREELLGQSVLCVDPSIGEPRFHYIKKALASGQCERYDYHHDWEGLQWHFNVAVAPLYGSEEVITIVTDARDWQLGWWQNRLGQ